MLSSPIRFDPRNRLGERLVLHRRRDQSADLNVVRMGYGRDPEPFVVQVPINPLDAHGGTDIAHDNPIVADPIRTNTKHYAHP